MAGQLLLVGQILNAAVYAQIGNAGVYYGVRLGHTIPWCTGFPFTVVSHAQYLGAVLSECAVFVFLGAGSEAHVESGIYGLCYVCVSLYAVSALVEQHL